jgi:hypothetical protein
VDNNVERRLALILEESLNRLASGEALEQVLASYPQEIFWLRPALEQAALLSAQKSKYNPVSGFIQTSRWRLLRRIRLELEVSTRKSTIWANILELLGGKRRMAFQIVSVVLVLALLLTGFMSTALASQSSLPGDHLYAVKLSLEEARLLLATDPVTEAKVEMQYAGNRLSEMLELVHVQRFPDLPQTLQHYQQHLWQALILLDQAAQSGDTARKTRAGVLAHEFRSLLAQQAADLELIDTQVRAENQAFSVSVQAVATQQGAQMQQLAVQIETQTTGIPTLLPATLSEPTRTNHSQPTSHLPGGGSGEQTATLSPSLTPVPTTTTVIVKLPSSTAVPVFVSSAAAPKPSGTPSLVTGSGGVSKPSPTKKPTNTAKPTSTLRPTNTNRPTQKPTDPLPTPRPTNPNRPTPKPTNPNKPAP